MISLAKSLLQRDFGNVVQKVCSCLLDHGRLPLCTLIQKTRLSAKQTKEALFILMQHSIVYWTDPFYQVQIEMILARMLGPKIILYAQRNHSKETGALVKHLFLNGIVPVESILSQNPKSFDWLKEKQLISQVENLNSPIAFKIQSASAVEFAPSSATSTEGQRKRKLNNVTADPAEQPKKQKLPQTQEQWKGYIRLNYPKFIQFQRQEFLLDHIQRKYNESARIVLATIFEQAPNTERGVLSIFQLTQALREKPPLAALQEFNASTLPNYIDLLVEDSCKVLVRAETSALAINERALDAFYRLRMIQSVVHAHFGAEALRILNLLHQTANALDDKLVCKHALLPMRQARDLLVRLMQWGMVASQEVPRTPDHMPSRTFFLWRFNLQKASNALFDHCSQALERLHQRCTVEYDASALLVAKTMRKDVQENPELLSAGEREALQVLYQTLNRLECSQMGNAVMLFCLNKVH